MVISVLVLVLEGTMRARLVNRQRLVVRLPAVDCSRLD
jgi:hypothetical protein